MISQDNCTVRPDADFSGLEPPGREAKVGHLDIKCAELCGLYHAYMETDGNVMSQDDFNNWVTQNGGHTA